MAGPSEWALVRVGERCRRRPKRFHEYRIVARLRLAATRHDTSLRAASPACRYTAPSYTLYGYRVQIEINLYADHALPSTRGRRRRHRGPLASFPTQEAEETPFSLFPLSEGAADAEATASLGHQTRRMSLGRSPRGVGCHVSP